jgi:hypothetical protein
VERAQFLMEADTESLVAAGMLQRRIVREAEADLRKLANQSKGNHAEFMEQSREKAKTYIDEKRYLQDINAEQANRRKTGKDGGSEGSTREEREAARAARQAAKEAAAAEREARWAQKRAEREEIHSARRADTQASIALREMENQEKHTMRRRREMLNQLAYGLGDVMSVQGGLAEMTRAASNNVQYMVAQVGGAAGAYLTMGAVAGQAILMVIGRMTGLKKETTEAGKAAEASQKAFRELAQAADDARMSEDELEKEKYIRDLREKAGKAETAYDAAKRARGAKESEIEGRSPFDWWKVGGKAALGGVADLFTLFQFHEQIAQFQSFNQLKTLQADEAARKNELTAAEKFRDQAYKGFDEKKQEKEAEKAIGKTKSDLENMYLQMMSRGRPETEAKEILRAQIEESLPEGMRAGAKRIADDIAREFKINVAGEQFRKNLASGGGDMEKLQTLQDQLRQAKIATAKAEAEALQDQTVESGEKEGIRRLKMEETRIEALIKALDENTKATIENNRQQVGDPTRSQLPTVNPQGNE